MDIGKKIKSDVELIYGSTKKCAEECGISRNTLMKIYSNGIDGIAVSSLSAVAKALGYDFDKLKNGEIVADQELVKRVKIPNATAKNPLEQEVIEKFRRLSIKGQLKLLDIMEDMMYVPKYQKED